jgi:DNA repair protein RecO (recombination protein O)
VNRRIELAPGYILHHRPYRDTSRILEVLLRDHGRLTLFARGVRGPRARLAGVLQPFHRLLLSFHPGRDAGQLTGAESAESAPPLPAGSLMAAFYLSELLLKLTIRHAPQPELFEEYGRALAGLREGGPLEPPLRLFEKRLLEALGYGLDLAAEARTGSPISAEGHYRFRASEGLLPAAADEAGAICGRSLLALAHEQLGDARVLEDARRVLGAALEECLEGRELATRQVARAVVRKGSHLRRE